MSGLIDELAARHRFRPARAHRAEDRSQTAAVWLVVLCDAVVSVLAFVAAEAVRLQVTAVLLLPLIAALTIVVLDRVEQSP